MIMQNIKQIYLIAKDYAIKVGKLDQDAELYEACDFGDSYGFLFVIEDKYANIYWCIEKETNKPFPFRPNIDVTKFLKRKILPIESVR